MVTAQVTFSKKELVANLQSRSPLVMFGVSWSDYEKISAEFGESSSFLISYRRGILKNCAAYKNTRGSSESAARLC